jgi:outer membrane protein
MKVLIIAISISVVACNKTAEVKEVKTAYVDTSVLMKEYTEAKDQQNIKHSLKKKEDN